MHVSLLISSYLLMFNPLDSPFANRIELMNECTIIVLTYGQMHFTDYMPEPETRNTIGYTYGGVVLINFSTHLIILIRDTCIKVKFACKRLFNMCRQCYH